MFAHANSSRAYKCRPNLRLSSPDLGDVAQFTRTNLPIVLEKGGRNGRLVLMTCSSNLETADELRLKECCPHDMEACLLRPGQAKSPQADPDGFGQQGGSMKLLKRIPGGYLNFAGLVTVLLVVGAIAYVPLLSAEEDGRGYGTMTPRTPEVVVPQPTPVVVIVPPSPIMVAPSAAAPAPAMPVQPVVTVAQTPAPAVAATKPQPQMPADVPNTVSPKADTGANPAPQGRPERPAAQAISGHASGATSSTPVQAVAIAQRAAPPASTRQQAEALPRTGWGGKIAADNGLSVLIVLSALALGVVALGGFRFAANRQIKR